MAEEVIIYIKPGCPYCRTAVEDLRNRGISYREINVEADPKALEEMLGWSKGERVVPVIVRGEEVTVGFGGG